MEYMALLALCKSVKVRQRHRLIKDRARLQRLDTPRAIKATAHQLARLIYAMLTRGEEYVEKGM